MTINKGLSQLDPGAVLKDVHNYRGHSLQVSNANSEVPVGYSRVELTKNSFGSVTKAVFYAGTKYQKTKIDFLADVAGSLNNMAFSINAAENDPKFYVWYNVNGAGVDPAIPNLIGLEVELNTNDSAEVVALATHLKLNAQEYFSSQITPGSTSITVENLENGTTTDTTDINSGFTFQTLVEGATEKIKTVELPDEENTRYLFNFAEGKFELAPYIAGEIHIIGLSDAQVAQRVTVISSGWTEISISVPDGTNTQVNIQNESEINKVRLNYSNAAPSNEGMLISPNLGERQYLINTGSIVFYVRAETGSAVLNIEVLSQ